MELSRAAAKIGDGMITAQSSNVSNICEEFEA
jgi:hypothetical protein